MTETLDETEVVEEAEVEIPRGRALVPISAAPPAAIEAELTVTELVARRDKILDAMKVVMVKDKHYGAIPGTGDKPTLLKPGAELLCLLFRLDPEPEAEETFYPDGHYSATVRTTIWHSPSGARLGAGLGSCSTRETKYAFRQAGRVCPDCGAEAIIKGKAEYGGGWVCLAPDTPILYSDYSWRPIGEAKPGDELLSFDECGHGGRKPRRFRSSVIEDVWASRQPTLRLVTENADVVTTASHRWLRRLPGALDWIPTERLEVGRSVRWLCEPTPPREATAEYRMGYLAGMTLGDGTMRYTPGQRSSAAHPAYWRVALSGRDEAVLGRLVAYLSSFGIEAHTRPFGGGPYSRAHQTYPLRKVEIRSISRLEAIAELLRERESVEWQRGFVAGFFDAEGSGPPGDHLRVYQGDTAVLERFRRYAQALGFTFDISERTDGRSNARLRGDTLEKLRFSECVQPALLRKTGVVGATMHGGISRIDAIEKGPTADVIDIQTSAGTFIAAGLATHNCFKKKGGCGAKWDDDSEQASAFEQVEVGRKERPRDELADSYNTVLKMAAKRSLTAAVLNTTGASELFTQDLEDMQRGDEPFEAATGREQARQTGGPSIPVPKNWAAMEAALTAAYTEVVVPDFEEFAIQLGEALFEDKTVERIFGGEPSGTLTKTEWGAFGGKCAGAVVKLLETVPREFPPPSRAEMQAAFASVADGKVLDGPVWSMSPEETDRLPRGGEVSEADRAEAERIANEAFDGGAS